MMSVNQIVTNFDILPNEILIECFRYLKPVHIFHSFDQLNSRFNTLIRHIPFHLDFRNIPQSICQRFCQTLIRDSELKKNIYSLDLSNKDTSIWIRLFLSIVSPADFSGLRSLSLTDVNDTNMDNLTATLYSMSSLKCLRLKDTRCDLSDCIPISARSALRTLTLCRLPRNIIVLRRLSFLKSLAVDVCDIYQLLKVLNAISTLKYLQINHLSTEAMSSDEDKPHQFTHSLQHLVIHETDYGIVDIKMIIKHTPKLTHLTLFADSHEYLVEAHEWERLLHTELPCLEVFKFCYQYSYRDDKSFMEEKLRAFQSDFWCNGHGRLIEYILSPRRAMIYTVPYEFSRFELHPGMERYYNTAVVDRSYFRNVTELSIHTDSIERDYHHSFYDRRSQGWRYDREAMLGLLTTNNIQPMIGNFSHVKHLDVSHVCRLENSSVLLEILKETRQVSSLTISTEMLPLSFDDNELCQYLNQMVHKLCIRRLWYFSTHDVVAEKFCEVFSDIEQLTCTVEDDGQVIYLLNHLSKLIRADFTVANYNRNSAEPQLEARIRELDMNVHIGYDQTIPSQITIWINRMITDNLINFTE